MEDLPWIEKYRPQTLNDVKGQINIVETIRKFSKREDMPNFLLYGPPGTGKTSAITAAVREIYKDNVATMVLELNVSDKRGIDSVRTDILDFVNKVGHTDSHKIVILDEIDAMTDDAQGVLKRIIEKYTFNARFFLICNFLNKINPALISRCLKLYFMPLDDKSIKIRIDEILEKENVKIEKEGRDLLIDRSKGDMRNILNSLQSISIADKKINKSNVEDYLLYPKEKHVLKIYKLLHKKISISYKKILKLKKKYKYSLSNIIDAISKYIIGIKEDCLAKKNKKKIIITLATIERNLAPCISERLQLMAFCGILLLDQ